MNTTTPQQHAYELHCDGLSTFLNMAAQTLEKRLYDNDLPSAEAVSLQAQAELAIHTLGTMAEFAARDQMANESSQHCASTLLMTARVMRELGSIMATANCAINNGKKHTARANATTVKSA
ncbi:hypothetical protein [Vitreoscilla stercoraria]|uniref:Uncharacterized protein n=1 Tax=Vitreoscilla stercoraria TaxID=61 RepID=A0ABY4EGZ5_VITST|nr:hypothetical protein [Vitreoscilla stercoraria]UOO92667.1 hypothetical protein LVJ81_01045 [Vitreoscilla stercoraria]